MAIVYIRRLEKGGFLGETKKKEVTGSFGDFTRIFGPEVKD